MIMTWKYPVVTVLVQKDEADGICVQKFKARVVGYAPSGDYRLEVFEETIIPKEKLEDDENPLRPQ